MSATDSFGDDCTWYQQNPVGCGLYDDDDFLANTACCACDIGGVFGGDIGGDIGGEDCESSAEFADSFGDGCNYYASVPNACGQYDTEEAIASDSCCACGGGL